MAYKLEGSLLEVCDCEILCPGWVGEAPDNGLTVASPPADPAQVAWTSKLVQAGIQQVRRGVTPQGEPRCSIVVVYPKSIDSAEVERVIANAVASALASLNVQPRELPLSPARIWQVIQSARQWRRPTGK